jgi:hypothetical protein
MPPRRREARPNASMLQIYDRNALASHNLTGI